METYNSASENESSESDEEIEIPSAKRRQTVPYTFMKSFSSTNETLEEVHKNEEWSHRATKPTAEGFWLQSIEILPCENLFVIIPQRQPACSSICNRR